MSYWVLLESTANTDTIDSLFTFLEENLSNVHSKAVLTWQSFLMMFDEKWKSKVDHKAYISFIESNGILQELASFLQAPPKISYYSELEL
jgi:hypothetical protein